MALAILDGTQTATTLSTILSSGQHITAHTVVSLGTQAITDITGAVSGSVVTIPNLNVLARSVATDGIADGTLNFVKIGGHQDGSNQIAHIVHVSGGGAMKVDASDSTVTFGAVQLRAGTTQIGSVTASISGTIPVSIASVTIGSLPLIAGTVTANLDGNSSIIASQVEIGIAGYAADLANEPFPISGTVTVGNSVTIGSLPAISGTVTANTFALQGTAVTTSNFTSTTASTLLASFNAGREVLTIFSEGPGTLFVCPGATCTTIQYQVRLSSGDYYEVPNHQTSITHSAVFQTAGTARVTEVS